MIESIKFCIWMAISQILAAWVAVAVISGIPVLIGTFYLAILAESADASPLWKHIIIWIICGITMILSAKLSLYSFRCALAIAEKTKDVAKKPGTKQGK